MNYGRPFDIMLELWQQKFLSAQMLYVDWAMTQ